MTTFGSESGAASRAVDCASGRGNSEADDRPEVEATASPEICSGERPFPAIVLEEGSAIHSRALSATGSRERRGTKSIQGSDLPVAGFEFVPDGGKLARKGVGTIALAGESQFLLRCGGAVCLGHL